MSKPNGAAAKAEYKSSNHARILGDTAVGLTRSDLEGRYTMLTCGYHMGPQAAAEAMLAAVNEWAARHGFEVVRKDGDK